MFFTILNGNDFGQFYIDSEGKYPIEKAVWENGSLKMKRTDHFPMIISFKNLRKTTNKAKVKGDNIWNLNKKGG